MFKLDKTYTTEVDGQVREYVLSAVTPGNPLRLKVYKHGVIIEGHMHLGDKEDLTGLISFLERAFGESEELFGPNLQKDKPKTTSGLTDSDVATIRYRHHTHGDSTKDLAEEFGISRRYTRKIIAGDAR